MGSSPRGNPAAGPRRSRSVAAGGGFAAALVVAVTSCGHSPSAPPPSASAGSRQSPSPRSDVAVLAAYQAEQAAFMGAIRTADASYAPLAETMVDPLLTAIRKQLIADHGNGIVGEGDVDLHPRVAWVRATEAEVIDCAFDRSQLVYVSSRQPVPPIKPPHPVSITADLVQDKGVWKVSTQSVSEAPCPTAS